MLDLIRINISNREILYEDTKQSLRKFIGDVTEQSLKLGSGVKLEPAFLTKREREILEAGCVKQPSGGNMSKLSRDGCTDVGGQCGGIGRIRKNRNPVGAMKSCYGVNHVGHIGIL